MFIHFFLFKRFIGEFEDGKMHGYGYVYFKNGDRYEGIVRKNKMQGKGKPYSKVFCSNSLLSFMWTF